jgi:hypothetical protein
MTDSDNAINDFEYSRRTYYDLITKGQDALEEMIEVAKALEHPRAFEVVAGMIKNISDVNDRLADLHKKKKDYMKKEDPKKDQGQITSTTNNVFIGSTTDLQRMLQDMNKSQDNIIDITSRIEKKDNAD